MKQTTRILGVTVALFSLTCICAFAADSDSDEVMDKGRRGGLGSRSFSAPRVQSRQQFRVPAQRALAQPRQQTLRTGAPGSQGTRFNQATQVRQQPQLPDNGYRPGIFNPPQYGDVAVWDRARGLRTIRRDSSPTASTAKPPGRLDAIGSIRLVGANPFPGQSVEPQVQDNGGLAPISASRSNSVRTHIPGRSQSAYGHVQAIFPSSIRPSDIPGGPQGDLYDLERQFQFTPSSVRSTDIPGTLQSEYNRMRAIFPSSLTPSDIPGEPQGDLYDVERRGLLPSSVRSSDIPRGSRREMTTVPFSVPSVRPGPSLDISPSSSSSHTMTPAGTNMTEIPGPLQSQSAADTSNPGTMTPMVRPATW